MVFNDYHTYIKAAQEESKKKFEAMAKEKEEQCRQAELEKKIYEVTYPPGGLHVTPRPPGGHIKIHVPTPAAARTFGVSHALLLDLKAALMKKHRLNLADDNDMQAFIDSL